MAGQHIPVKLNAAHPGLASHKSLLPTGAAEMVGAAEIVGLTVGSNVVVGAADMVGTAVLPKQHCRKTPSTAVQKKENKPILQFACARVSHTK